MEECYGGKPAQGIAGSSVKSIPSALPLRFGDLPATTRKITPLPLGRFSQLVTDDKEHAC